MDPAKLDVLLGAAVSIAFIHTLIGVDHFLPFIVLGRAQNWTLRKVLTITALCGAGHVLSSVVLGFVGIGVGAAIGRLVWLEDVRGSLAAWLLIVFGTTYAVWATWRALRGRTHAHAHVHADGTRHDHRLRGRHPASRHLRGTQGARLSGGARRPRGSAWHFVSRT